MFAEFLKQNEFYQKYMQLFTFRFTVGNLEMEDSKTEITDSNRAIEMYNNMNAFMKLIERNPDKLTPFDVIETADLVNKNIEFFQKGYRKTQVDVKKQNIFFLYQQEKYHQRCMHFLMRIIIFGVIYQFMKKKQDLI